MEVLSWKSLFVPFFDVLLLLSLEKKNQKPISNLKITEKVLSKVANKKKVWKNIKVELFEEGNANNWHLQTHSYTDTVLQIHTYKNKRKLLTDKIE